MDDSKANDKTHIKSRIQQDPNVLYNYATNLLLLSEVCELEYVDFIPDARSEKHNSRWNFTQYFNQILLEKCLTQNIINKSCLIMPTNSQYNLGLQFIDYYVALVWSSFEFGNNYLNLNMPSNHHLVINKQFFGK
ncbi:MULTISPECIES: hypothetical protein [unclassified Moraxella]|uniref:hypothetical protein n=1 Tax=unclassified Moraxella TaxID=2685852 RepID=UPI003AF51408